MSTLPIGQVPKNIEHPKENSLKLQLVGGGFTTIGGSAVLGIGIGTALGALGYGIVSYIPGAKEKVEKVAKKIGIENIGRTIVYIGGALGGMIGVYKAFPYTVTLHQEYLELNTLEEQSVPFHKGLRTAEQLVDELLDAAADKREEGEPGPVLCSIHRTMMLYPVRIMTCTTIHYFEAEAIQESFNRRDVCPVCTRKFTLLDLRLDMACAESITKLVKKQINTWQKHTKGEGLLLQRHTQRMWRDFEQFLSSKNPKAASMNLIEKIEKEEEIPLEVARPLFFVVRHYIKRMNARTINISTQCRQQLENTNYLEKPLYEKDYASQKTLLKEWFDNCIIPLPRVPLLSSMSESPFDEGSQHAQELSLPYPIWEPLESKEHNSV